MPNLYNTRNINEKVSPSLAIIKGMAADQGLYCFKLDEILKFDLEAWQKLNYQQLAKVLIKHFFDDLDEKMIEACVLQAYDSKFDVPDCVKLQKYGLFEL